MRVRIDRHRQIDRLAARRRAGQAERREPDALLQRTARRLQPRWLACEKLLVEFYLYSPIRRKDMPQSPVRRSSLGRQESANGERTYG